jgi:hypothetical protein
MQHISTTAAITFRLFMEAFNKLAKGKAKSAPYSAKFLEPNPQPKAQVNQDALR